MQSRSEWQSLLREMQYLNRSSIEWPGNALLITISRKVDSYIVNIVIRVQSRFNRIFFQIVFFISRPQEFEFVTIVTVDLNVICGVDTSNNQ